MLKSGRTFFALAASLALAGGSALIASPAVAQDEAKASVGVEANVYADLVTVMFAAADREAELNNGMEVLRRQFAADPDFAQLERESPGYIDDIIEAMRPIMRDIADSSEALMREEFVRIFGDSLTQDEAIELTALFRDPIFQQLMRRMSQNFSPEAMLGDLESKAPIERDQLSEDVTRAAAAAVGEFDTQELIEMNQRILGSQAWQRFVEIQPQMVDMRLKYENAPLTPAEDRALGEAFERVDRKHFPQ